ncbi:uncharacterized protein LOC121639995 [Melanotaenia boesemani]|uniref:uncharacterized protein LOC121639995 n=1 Tax=Melanotaenia boesemani TaxID=1250792 RepID=UPI001C05850A|nr:uncharacterized protein LOC121639995 [Melanotaenia boesemani]
MMAPSHCLSWCFLIRSALLVWVFLHDVEAFVKNSVIHKKVGDTVKLSSGLSTEGVTVAQWKYGRIKLAEKSGVVSGNHQFQSRLEFNPTDFSLTVKKLTLQDSGDFILISGTNNKQRPSVVITLKVHEPITEQPILTSRSIQTFLNGSCVVLLECKAASNVSYSITVGNQTYNESRLQYIIRAQDGGTTFSCTVSNVVSQKSASKTVTCDRPEEGFTKIILIVRLFIGILIIFLLVLVLHFTNSKEILCNRSFPGIFGKKSYLGKRKTHNPEIRGPPSSKTWKPFSFHVYLLNCKAEITPSSSQEFELAQTGLDKRHLTMSRDMSHEEACLRKVQTVSVTPPPDHTDTEELDEEKLPCPVCNLKFAPNFLKIHASICGERSKDDLTMDEIKGNKGEEEHIKSIDDVLNTIWERVDVEKQFNIHISRTNILERGLLQWQRQKTKTPTATLNVSFFGEAGVDNGALRKEFLTEMVAKIETRFFEGPPHQKSPRYSLTDFDNGFFRTIGEILAVSLAQGGPAPAFFSPWVYSYFCNGEINPTLLDKNTVADSQLLSLIDQVESSTEQTVEGLTDEILNCGFTGAISVQNKELIVRAIILHAVLKLQPMLEELREGLQLYGLLELIKQHPDTCQPLFVPGEDVKVNAEFVMASIHPQLSEKGTTRHQVELEMLNFIQDFLYESEESPEHLGDEGGPRSVTPAMFLQWITGHGHIPLLPSEKKDFAVVIKFNHDCGADFGNHSICYPLVSACAKTIVLPVKHMKSYDQFKMVLMEAFHLGQDFNKELPLSSPGFEV